jgi:transcription initiation factor IIE alpha subunit
MEINLDRERIYIQCPRCNFYARPFLRQVRHHEILICGGCKANLHLVDHMGQYRKAESRVRRLLKNLAEQFRNLNLTVKL